MIIIPKTMENFDAKRALNFTLLRLAINKLIMRLIYLINETAWDVIKCQAGKQAGRQRMNERPNECSHTKQTRYAFEMST